MAWLFVCGRLPALRGCHVCFVREHEKSLVVVQADKLNQLLSNLDVVALMTARVGIVLKLDALAA